MNDIIKLQVSHNIAVIKMEDGEGKNTFTHKFVEEMLEVFQYIESSSDIKVVILTGYDTYFSCGAPKGFLLALQQSNSIDGDKKLNFNESGLNKLLLECKVPVISAMQGHAVGGGLVFGSYADIIILSEESIYTTNFMKYGFTPGMGATFIIPYKYGNIMASEMLFTACSYNGLELKQRGINAKVVKRKDVFSTALLLAREIAEKPIESLILLKDRFRDEIAADVEHAIACELKMHEKTFAQAEVRNKILSLY